VKALSHPSREVRLVAQRRLADRKAAKELEAAATGPAPAAWHAIWALDALGGSPAVRAALRHEDPSVRRQAARQLGTRRVKEAVEPLVGLLKDPDATVRFHAATALGRIGSAPAVPALLAALEEQDLFARYAAFTALRRIGLASSTAWPEIVKGLASGSPRIREGAQFALREAYDEPLAAALASAPRSAATIAALAEIHRKPPAWKGNWWGTQPVAQPRPAKTVEYGGTKIALEAVRAALGDADASVRRAAIEAVPVVRDAGAAPVLRELFAKEGDAGVKKAILRAVGTLKDAPSTPLVEAALKDPALLPESAQAAEQIGGAALVGALIEALPSAGLPAVEALGRLKAPAAAGPLAAQLRHPDAKVVQAVVTSLTAIGGAPAVQALLPVVEDPRAEVRRAAVVALGSLKAKDALAALLRAYLDRETRFEAVAALAQIPDLRALEAYLEGLGGKNATVRQQCAAAVAAVGAAALPEIERRLAAQQLSAETILELQRIYNKPLPVTEWKLLGSFPKSAKEPFPPDAVPLDAEFTDSRGKPVRWKAAKVGKEHGEVELRGQMTVPDDSAAYAYAEIVSETERDVELLAGADDSLTIWLNGRKIFEDLNDGGWKVDEIRARGTLRAGKNALLVKCGNSGGGWMFSVALPGARKGPLFEASAKKLDPKAYEKHALGSKGDPARGKALFSDVKGVACIKCHRIGAEGGEVGPDLRGVGAKYSRAQLVESVLYPSKQILDGYRQTMVLTKGGEVRSGRFVGDTPDELTLLDAEGKRHAIRKSDIDQRKESDLSLMPDGLNTGLSLQDFADLVTFLEGLKEPAK
jgi:putative heme-binding domain-containing protein